MSFEHPTSTSARARRAYLASTDELSAAVEAAIVGLPRWRLESKSAGELHAVRRTRLLRFEDDVTVSIVALDNGSEARFESASRVGKGDAGQSPRNLKELLDTIDRELG